MYAAIMDKPENSAFWESISGGMFQYDFFTNPGQLNLITKPDIIFISGKFLAGLPGYTFAQIRAFPQLTDVPAVAVTSNGGCENQERLCNMGFDDIFCLPMCKQFIKKRVNVLMQAVASNSADVNAENIYLTGYDGENGSFCVRSEDFAHIYKYVLRMLERLDKDAQMLVMNLEFKGSSTDELTLKKLSDVAQKSLRRGDMSAICGGNQVIILLIGADDEGGRLVATRIARGFMEECSQSGADLSYDIREVRVHKEERNS